MKEQLKNVIKPYLDERAATDELFANTYAKENKNIDECCDYIISEARKKGNAVFMSDAEVYSLAIHYYDEDEIKVEKVSNARVATSVSSTPVELTEEEKEAARERALLAYEASEQKKIEEAHKRKLKKKAEKAAQQQEVQPSLFEF